MPDRPTVAVIGGGYAGHNVAHELDQDADVVLVEPREAFFHNIAALRALVDPDWLPQIFFPYDGLLEHGRVIRDRAVEVDAGRVTLATREELTPDYIVLATGSRYPFPAKTDALDTDDAHTRHRGAHSALTDASRVLILGGGPVGLELAGEVKAAWPEKGVTIVDIGDDILAGPFQPELRAELNRQLDALGVELVLGSPLRAMPPIEPGTLGSFTVETQAGTEVSADIWFRAYGVTPVTDYLTGSLAAARRDNGDLDVTPELRLRGQERVFALGDIVDVDAKMAGTARLQAEIVVANIRALIDGTAALAAYERMPAAIFVPLGPEGGAGQMPGAEEISGPAEVSAIKGSHMMVDGFADRFGLAQPSRT